MKQKVVSPKNQCFVKNPQYETSCTTCYISTKSTDNWILYVFTQLFIILKWSVKCIQSYLRFPFIHGVKSLFFTILLVGYGTNGQADVFSASHAFRPGTPSPHQNALRRLFFDSASIKANFPIFTKFIPRKGISNPVRWFCCPSRTLIESLLST